MANNADNCIYLYMDETGSSGDTAPLISCGVAVLDFSGVDILINKYITRAKKEFPEVLKKDSGVLHFTNIIKDGYDTFLLDLLSELDKEKIRIFYHFDKKDKATNIKGVITDKKTPLKSLLNYLLDEAWDWSLISSKSGIKVFCDKGYYDKYGKELLTESQTYINVSGPKYNPTLTIRVPRGTSPKNIHNENFEVQDGNFKIKHEIVNKNNTGLQMTDIVCGALRQKFINNNPIFIEPLKKRINNYKE